MPITIDFARLKSVTTNNVNAVIAPGAPIEVDTGVEESQFIPFTHASITPATFNVSGCNITTGSATITTTTANGFANVRIGDVVTVSSGGGTIAANTVTAINSTTSITISVNATAPSTTANSTVLTFTPPAITPTTWGIRLLYEKRGSATDASRTIIVIRPTLYLYDGTLGGTAGTPANATIAINLVDSQGNAPSIDLDALYNAIRVGRSA